jgi:hypothetical protein
VRAALLSALCTFLPAALTLPSDALALSARGHVAAGSFGAPGGGDGQLNQPAGIAVNEATGDVYVVDAGNSRIERFAASGAFLEAWGWGVADGNKEYERCSAECRPGLPGNGKDRFNRPAAIAIDNSQNPEDPSAGDVYVEANTTEEHETIDKFSATGLPLDARHASREGELEELHGLAVAPNGALWVYNEEQVYVFDDSERNHQCPRAGKQQPATCPGFGTLEPEIEGAPRDGIALDGNGAVYLGQDALGARAEPAATIGKFELAPVQEHQEPTLEDIIPELDHQPASALAVDPSTGTVYLEHGRSIAAFDKHGALIQQFGEAPGGLTGAAGIAVVSAASATDPQHAGYVYVAEPAAGKVEVFAPEPPRVPQIDDLSAQDVTGEGSQLNAQLDPGGSTTGYRFEYGQAPCAATPSTCVSLPAAPGEVAPSCPRSDEDACFFDASISVQATALSPGTTYHYRLTATNAQGTTHSGELTFTTGPPEGHFLADKRGWEMVSPTDMNGGEAEPLSEVGGLIQASQSGTALAWVSTAPLGEAEGNRSLEATQLISTRGPTGWSTQDIVTPNEQGTGIELGTQEYRMFSSSLALSLLQPFTGGGKLAEPPLSPPGPAEPPGTQEKTVYVRADAPLTPQPGEKPIYEQAIANGQRISNPGFLALVTAENVLANTQFGRQVKVLDATPDLSHAVIESEVALTPGSANGRNLYEWTAGTLQPINVLPGEEHTPAPGSQLGDGNTMIRGAISTNGTRVFWTNNENHLYVRDTSRGETLQLDGASAETGRAIFQGASADGSTVFFTDEDKLTPSSHAAIHKPDLYACEIGEAEGRLTCNLSDLTPSPPGESADVLGLALGGSADGSSIYFVANGALSADASPGQCRPEPQPGAECNLYLATREGNWLTPRLVARVGNQDSADWQPRRSPIAQADLGEITASSSPNGRYLAFMSARSLTGYDNRDANPAAGNARDEEVFLYDSAGATLTCVSCNPTGARPRGVLDPPDSNPANPEGWGLVVDRMKIWQNRWLAGSLPGWTKSERDRALYQSRYLSDSGRLYFNSPAGLVPEAVNKKEDVYEYEPLGTPRGQNQCTVARRTFVASINGCLGLISSGSSPREAAFLDASLAGGEKSGAEAEEGGGEAFFLAAGLSAADAGASFAVYDAHECTLARPCASPEETKTTTPCTSTETCRPLSYLPPASHSPATATTPSAGNVLHSITTVKPKATRAQLLVAALKACKKKRNRHRRHVCEAQARKRYGPVHHTTKGHHR